MMPLRWGLHTPTPAPFMWGFHTPTPPWGIWMMKKASDASNSRRHAPAGQPQHPCEHARGLPQPVFRSCRAGRGRVRRGQVRDAAGHPPAARGRAGRRSAGFPGLTVFCLTERPRRDAPAIRGCAAQGWRHCASRTAADTAAPRRRAAGRDRSRPYSRIIAVTPPGRRKQRARILRIRHPPAGFAVIQPGMGAPIGMDPDMAVVEAGQFDLGRQQRLAIRGEQPESRRKRPARCAPEHHPVGQFHHRAGLYDPVGARQQRPQQDKARHNEQGPRDGPTGRLHPHQPSPGLKSLRAAPLKTSARAGAFPLPIRRRACLGL